MKKVVFIIITFLLILTSCIEDTDSGDFLVKINGQELYDEDLRNEITQEIEQLKSEGLYISPEDEKEIKKEVLAPLIRKTVLLQESNEEIYKPDEKVIEDRLQKYLEQIPKKQSVQNYYGMTEEELKKGITEELQINNYVIDYASKNNLEDQLVVTDKEIEEGFEDFKDFIGGQEEMVLEDYYDDVKDVIKDEKLKELRNNIADELISKSEIVYGD